MFLLFLVLQNETKTVQMMYQMKKLPYNYIPELELQILELPYVKQELSMFILLPQLSTDGSDPLLKVQDEKKTQKTLKKKTKHFVVKLKLKKHM